MRADEDLATIFTWQEERKLSTNLTIHYKCISDLVTPSPATLALRGHRVQVHEDADGQLTERHYGTLLPITPFVDKKPMVRQADIVANKRDPRPATGPRCRPARESAPHAAPEGAPPSRPGGG